MEGNVVDVERRISAPLLGQEQGGTDDDDVWFSTTFIASILFFKVFEEKKTGTTTATNQLFKYQTLLLRLVIMMDTIRFRNSNFKYYEQVQLNLSVRYSVRLKD